MAKKQTEKTNSCGDVSLDALGTRSHEETVVAREGTTGQKHPTPEQLLIREATKTLTPTQLKVWELWNYDRLTQDEIGLKLKMTQQGVCKHLKAIEKRITRWVQGNMGAYRLIKEEMEK